MAAIPFIYFSLLSFLFYRRNKRVDLAVFISLCYAFTGLFSILYDVFGVRSSITSNYHVSLLAAFVYCLCITLCIWPVARFSKSFQYGLKPLPNDKLLRIIADVLFIFFLLFLLLAYQEIISVLTGDIGDVRNEVYRGTWEVSWMKGITNPLIRVIVVFFNLLTGAPWVFVMLGFYSSVIQKMKGRYTLMFFAVSLLGPLNGILIADRSVTTYWVLAIIANYILFRPYMDRRQAKNWLNFGMVLVALALVYISMTTTSRFEEHSGAGGLSGSQLSVVAYLGQNFFGFCYFFDEFETPYIFPGILFPFITDQLGGLSGATSLQELMDLRTGIQTGVFYTFLGHIKIFAGPVVMFLYVLFINLGGSALLRRMGSNPSLFGKFCYMLVASVSLFGLFVHYYAGSSKTFCVAAFFVIISAMSTRKAV